MKRKVIQIADSTQLVSLPRKWCKEFNIKKGDELDVEAVGNKVVINTEKGIQSEQVEVDVSELDRSSIIYLIRGLYKKGYDEIKITFNNPMTTHYRLNEPVKVISAIHKEANRLSGMEVIQQKENFCMLKSISTGDIKELNTVLRRIFILLLDACKDLITAAKNNDHVLYETLEEKHDTLTRFVSYCLRLINKQRDETKSTHFLYHIIANLDKITDVIKNAARELMSYDKKVQEETGKILDMIYKSYELFYDLYYNFSPGTVNKISEQKEKIITLLLNVSKKITKQEILLLFEMHQSLELIRDLVESRIAMEY